MLTQPQLKVVNEILVSRLDDLIDELEINVRRCGREYVGTCCVHGGDNKTALKIYPEGYSQNGGWLCYTRGCQKIFPSNLIGLTQGALSNLKYGWSGKNDKIISFKETLSFIEKFIGKPLDKIKVDRKLEEKNKFVRDLSVLIPNKPELAKWTISSIRDRLSIPSKIFQERGLKAEALDLFSVGESLTDDIFSPMYKRIVVPVFDTDGKYIVGCTGRSIYKECPKCKSYHAGTCPVDPSLPQYRKWRNTSNLQAANTLFGYHLSRQNILKTRKLFIVEGPIDCIKLWQCGINNVVALLGIDIKSGQRDILESSGAMELIVLGDNDEAGQEMFENINNSLSRLFKIRQIKFPDSIIDIDELSDSDVQNLLR